MVFMIPRGLIPGNAGNLVHQNAALSEKMKFEPAATMPDE
jgi:hypothetical protein